MTFVQIHMASNEKTRLRGKKRNDWIVQFRREKNSPNIRLISHAPTSEINASDSTKNWAAAMQQLKIIFAILFWHRLANSIECNGHFTKSEWNLHTIWWMLRWWRCFQNHYSNQKKIIIIKCKWCLFIVVFCSSCCCFA